MKKLYLLALVAFFTLSTSVVIAEPVDSGPPAQQQKDVVPDSTSNGNYLEPQPDENGANNTGNQNQTPDKKSKKHRKAASKPTNLEKGKSHTESPDEGGVVVK
jgi:hypothetical protein